MAWIGWLIIHKIIATKVLKRMFYWTYRLSCNDHRAAMLYKHYQCNGTEIIMQSLKVSNLHAYINV